MSMVCRRLDSPKQQPLPQPQATKQLTSSGGSIRRTSSLSSNLRYYSSSSSSSSSSDSSSSTSSTLCISLPPITAKHHPTNHYHQSHKSMSNMNETIRSDCLESVVNGDNSSPGDHRFSYPQFMQTIVVPSITMLSMNDVSHEQEDDNNKYQSFYYGINHRHKMDSTSNISMLSDSHSIHHNRSQSTSPSMLTPFDLDHQHFSSLPSSTTSSPMSSTDSDIIFDNDQCVAVPHNYSPTISPSISPFTLPSPNCYSNSSHPLPSPSISTSSSVDGHNLTDHSTTHYSDYHHRSSAVNTGSVTPSVSIGNLQNNLYLTSNSVSNSLPSTSISTATITTVTLNHILNQFKTPITQIQAWALIYQSIVSLQSMTAIAILTNNEQVNTAASNNNSTNCDKEKQQLRLTSLPNLPLPDSNFPNIILDCNGNVIVSTWFSNCDTNSNDIDDKSDDCLEVDSSNNLPSSRTNSSSAPKLDLVDKYRNVVNDRINQVMCSLATKIGAALSYGLPDNEEADLEPDLEFLFLDMLLSFNSDSQRHDSDEGIEEPDENELFGIQLVRQKCVKYFNNKILPFNRYWASANPEKACQVFTMLCEQNSIESIDADLYYRTVCEVMVSETIKLGKLLEQLHNYKNTKTNIKWQNSSSIGEIQDETANLKLWAKTWIKVMSEMRFGEVRLRPVSKDDSPKDSSKSKSSQLMEQIRMKRTILRKTPVNQYRDQLSQSISFPVVHSSQSQYFQPPITQTMILDRLQNLKSATARNLSPIPPPLPCLHERLMTEIRSCRIRLRPTITVSKPSQNLIFELYLSERNNRYRRKPIGRPTSEIYFHSHNHKAESLNRLLSFPVYGQMSDQYVSDDAQLANISSDYNHNVDEEDDVKVGRLRRFRSLIVPKKHKRKNLNESDVVPNYCIDGQMIQSDTGSYQNQNHASLSIFSSNLFTSPRKSNRSKKNKKNNVASRSSSILVDDSVGISSVSIVDNTNNPLVRFSSVSASHLWQNNNQNQAQSANKQSTPTKNLYCKNTNSLMLPPLSPISASSVSLNHRSPLQVLGRNATLNKAECRSQSILNSTAANSTSPSSAFHRSKLNTLLRRSFVRKSSSASSYHRQMSEMNDNLHHRNSSFYEDSQVSNENSMNGPLPTIRSSSNWNLSRLWSRFTSNISPRSNSQNSKVKEE